MAQTPHFMANQSLSGRNRNRFVAFRVLFNARFYYPVLAVFFLDLGVSATQYTLLNFVWALVIVCAEVPSGVLADRIGRKPLVVAAAVCMVLEMAALLWAPRNGGLWMFGLCVLNRVLSGIAEAMASGADESLAYDSLSADGDEGAWPIVLSAVMRWQSVAMLITTLVGATVYDAPMVNRALAWGGSFWRLDAAVALKLPIALTLVNALLATAVVVGMREPPRAPPDPSRTSPSSWGDMVGAAKWTMGSKRALFAILCGVLLDSVSRLFLTFASAFYRLIDLPATSFGIIGAAMGGLGLVVAPFAAWLTRTGSLLRGFAILSALTLFGLVGVSLKTPYWGVLFTIPMVCAMFALGMLVSNTLNASVASEQRATVLSFKGLLFNLGYGFVSLLFALLLRVLGGREDAADAFAKALTVLPLWLALTLLMLAIAFRKHRSALGATSS